MVIYNCETFYWIVMGSTHVKFISVCAYPSEGAWYIFDK